MFRKSSFAFWLRFENGFAFWLRFGLRFETLRLRFAFLRFGSAAKARTHKQGWFEAVTVTCLLHKADGKRCNKSFTPGPEWTEAQVTARIKEWCARGLDIPDEAGGKQRHMAIKPRDFGPEEVRGGAELAAAVGGLL